jgi:type IV pilus assembly protein PilX
MKNRHSSPSQQGVALVVALLFLLVVTVISVIAASNSAIGLKMSANMADSYASFQSAEAGIIAALSLAGTANDPFDGDDSQDIFREPEGPKYWRCNNANNPLRALNDGACAVETDVFLTTAATACPRNSVASSVGLFDCDYYRITSEHEVPREARTRVELGVVKTIIGSGTP